jgi:hypothetical protein
LDRVRVERRAIPSHGSIVIELPFPPATRERTQDGEPSLAYEEWRNDAHEAIATQRPRCAPGPVEIAVTLEERNGFRAFDHLGLNIIEALVKAQIIAAGNSRIVRRLTLQWGASQRGARVKSPPSKCRGRPKCQHLCNSKKRQ